jgi:hypothetical protein
MLFFYVLSTQVNPIDILLKICPYASDDFKSIFLSFNGILNNMFLDPFLLAYQSLTLSFIFVVEVNF